MMGLITTTLGELDEADLDKTEGGFDNEDESTTWVEYRLKGAAEVIHRSAHVRLKKPVTMEPTMGAIG